MPYVDARLPLLYGLALDRRGRLRPGAHPRVAGILSHDVRPLADDRRRVRRVVHRMGGPAIRSSATRFRWILSGLLIVGLIGYLLRPPHATAAVACALAALAATTVWSDWGRVKFGRTWFDVSVPPVEPNALVLLVVDAPMAYVLPFFPGDARHVGIRNNVTYPGRQNRLSESAAAAVRDHRGPLYALSFPKGQGDADLLAHRVRRVPGGCSDVRSNMPTGPIELCRLERIDAPAR